MTEVCYSDQDTGRGRFKVTFFVKASRATLTKSFDSPFFAERFVRKLKRSKTCVLLSYPTFN